MGWEVWIGVSGRGGGNRGHTVGWEGERVGIDTGEWVGGGVWIGMSGRGGGEGGQTVGWEGERVEIDRGSGVGGGESGDR